MSFSSVVRLELSHTHVDKDCCKRAEIAGMLLSSGNLLLTGGGGVALTLSSELAATARHIYLLIKDSFNARCEIVVSRREYPKVRNVYTLTLRGADAEKVLVECGAVHKSYLFALRNCPSDCWGGSAASARLCAVRFWAAARLPIQPASTTWSLLRAVRRSRARSCNSYADMN